MNQGLRSLILRNTPRASFTFLRDNDPLGRRLPFSAGARRKAFGIAANGAARALDRLGLRQIHAAVDASHGRGIALP
ncbi:MAG TPA: hypothetical protein VG840_03140, partial [Casimicrobiaceae bacterium]|nr:hypothetical protein [Casimicrobiaceae bacterium]